MSYERHVFRQLAPTRGETANKFKVCLRKQGRRCTFGAALEENLRHRQIEKLSDVELKKKLLEVNNITLEAAMDKVRKWEASREQASQMVAPNQEPGAVEIQSWKFLGTDPKGKVAKPVSTVVKTVTLLKAGIVQLEVESAVHVVNNYAHYASCCKGEKSPKSGKQNSNEGEADSNIVVKEDRPIL